MKPRTYVQTVALYRAHLAGRLKPAASRIGLTYHAAAMRIMRFIRLHAKVAAMIKAEEAAKNVK